MKRIEWAIILLLLLSISGLAQLPPTDRFFEIERSLEDIRRELAEIRQQIRNMEVRTSTPVIRQEIARMIQPPEITHEVILKNGTVVKGKLIEQDLKKIVIQTSIGELIISSDDVEITRKVEKPSAKCELEGSLDVKTLEDKIVFAGKIKNKGTRRADFPRLIFSLYDESTNLVARDSVFVGGHFHIYKSGIQTDATIYPEEIFGFECVVKLPKDKKYSYYLYKIVWDEFD